MKVQARRKRGRHKRRWLDKEKDDIKEKKRRDCRQRKCTTVLHGGVCHRTSTPRKSGNKMKEKKKRKKRRQYVRKDCFFKKWHTQALDSTLHI